MSRYRIQVVLSGSGWLVLKDLPFEPGTVLEVSLDAVPPHGSPRPGAAGEEALSEEEIEARLLKARKAPPLPCDKGKAAVGDDIGRLADYIQTAADMDAGRDGDKI
jgi:hypothetical protein